MPHSTYRIAVIGAGALGAIYASLLSRTAHSVSFIAAGERHDRLKRDGVIVNETRYAIDATTPEKATPVDLLMVAVKHHHLDEAIAQMTNAVGPATAILSVMNGIDSEERIGAAFGMEKVLYGLSLGIDAVREGNAVTYQNLGRIQFGERENGTLSDRVRWISALFNEAGIANETPRDMIRNLWFKYMINIGVNQVSAVLRATYGALRESAEAREMMEGAMREVIAVAVAAKVDLGDADIDQWYRILASLGASGKTSMLQDIEAGRKTEVEMLAGTLIRLGRGYGIATPVNERLFDEISGMETGSRSS